MGEVPRAQQAARNKQLIAEYHELAVNRKDFAAARDGSEGLREFFTRLAQQYPDFRVEIRRVFIEGDMVAVHVRSFNGATPNGEAGVDIFRLEDAKIVEHWGVVQPIPERMPHSNTMF